MWLPNKRAVSASFIVLFISGSAFSAEQPRNDKVLLGSHIGYASIVMIAGIDTDQAMVKFERKLDDVVEDCARNIGANEDGTVPSEKVANCAKAGITEWGKKVLTRRAVCPRSTLYTEFGNYSLIDYVREEDQDERSHMAARSHQLEEPPGRSDHRQLQRLQHTATAGHLPHPLPILVQGRVRGSGPILRRRPTGRDRATAIDDNS